MLTRQKVILELLRAAGRPVGATELTKWAFVLREERPSAGGSSFYDFLPYRYGPFSFALFHELGKLRDGGYVAERKHGSVTEYRLADMAGEAAAPQDREKRDIRGVVQEMRFLSHASLIDRVYARHPYFTVNSEIRRLREKPVAQTAVYTAGYEGRSVDRFLNLLIGAGMECLVDVRRNPVARRYGFHKSTLGRLCGRLQIEYQHFPSLGISSADRRGLSGAAAYNQLFADYEAETLSEETADINRLTRLVRSRPCVLVCMEADPAACHRTRLANRIASETGLPVVHLGCRTC